MFSSVNNFLLPPFNSLLNLRMFNLWTQGPDFASKAVDIAAGELISIATPGQGLLCMIASLSFCAFLVRFLLFKSSPLSLHFFLFFYTCVAVSEVQLKRAKESTKSAVLMNLESRV